MTLTGPIRLPDHTQDPAPHPPITVRARIPDTVNGLSWTDVLRQVQGRLELAILRNLQPSPWTIIDGHTTWKLDTAAGGTWILEGIWRQR